MSLLTNEILDAELVALLEREKKLKQIRAVQIRVQKLEAKLIRPAREVGAMLVIVGNYVSQETGISWDEIQSKTKIQRIADARQMVCYFARKFGGGLSDIGKQLRIDHGTVHYSYHKILDWMSSDKKFAARMTALEPKIRAELVENGLIE